MFKLSHLDQTASSIAGHFIEQLCLSQVAIRQPQAGYRQFRLPRAAASLLEVLPVLELLLQPARLLLLVVAAAAASHPGAAPARLPGVSARAASLPVVALLSQLCLPSNQPFEDSRLLPLLSQDRLQRRQEGFGGSQLPDLQGMLRASLSRSIALSISVGVSLRVLSDCQGSQPIIASLVLLPLLLPRDPSSPPGSSDPLPVVL